MQLPLHIFVEVNEKRLDAERHEYGTSAYVYRLADQDAENRPTNTEATLHWNLNFKSLQ